MYITIKQYISRTLKMFTLVDSEILLLGIYSKEVEM